MRKLLISGVITVGALGVPAIASAHVIVTPDRVRIGQELIFTVSVPNERSVAVADVTLDIPKGVTAVLPTTTPGWDTTTSGAGDNISAIIWRGNMPVGERQSFSFSAQVPASAGQLDWKAFQTYADGTTVHWDQAPSGNDDATGNAGPYSVTRVVNDLSANSGNSENNDSNKITLALIFSVAALLFSLGSLFLRPRKQ